LYAEVTTSSMFDPKVKKLKKELVSRSLYEYIHHFQINKDNSRMLAVGIIGLGLVISNFIAVYHAFCFSKNANWNDLLIYPLLVIAATTTLYISFHKSVKGILWKKLA